MKYLLVRRDGLEAELMFPGFVRYQSCDARDFAGDIPHYKPLNFFLKNSFLEIHPAGHLLLSLPTFLP